MFSLKLANKSSSIHITFSIFSKSSIISKWNTSFVFLVAFLAASTVMGQTSVVDGYWNTGSTWSGGAVPGPTSTVNAGTTITLNTNISISSGVYNFGYNGTSNTSTNITDPAGGTAQTLTINNAGGYNAAQAILDIKSGTTTFEGAASFTNANIFVRSGATLILGPTTISSSGKTYITVETGATLIVNGNFTDGNTGGVFSILGFVQVNGNYSTSTGNVVVIATSGSFQTTGTLTTSGSSSVNGTNNDCTTGPCSAAALSCTNSGNTAFTGYVTSNPSNGTVCSGGGVTLTFNSSALPSPGIISYQWQSSPDLITITTISLATSQTYGTSLTADTYFRVVYSVNKNGCPIQTSAWVKISVVNATNTSTQTICSTTTAILSGNQPGTGSTGAWSVVSGPSSLTTQFSSLTSYNSGFTPAGGAGSYSLRWTITNASCGSPITADATITVLGTPAAAVSISASSGSAICAGSSVTFTATPTNGGSIPSYQWTKNGSNIAGATNSTYTTASLVGGDAIRCIMTSSLSCATGSPVTSAALTVTPANTAGAASSAPTLCINTALTNITHTTTGATGISNSGVSGANGLPAGVSAILSGNTIIISGTPTVNGVFGYTIPLTGGCGSVNATGTITVVGAPTIATNGSTQSICSTGTATLSGNTATVGTGAWSVVSGPSLLLTQFSNTASPTATFTPTGGVAGSYVVRWTISNSPCTASTADATITVVGAPTTATNGSTQSICSTGTATLSGNTTTVGTGAWSVVSGPSTLLSQFSNTASPTATFTPAGGAGSYVVRWTISNSPCTASTADATITVVGAPTTATNGSTQSICSTGTATLSGNTATVGTGAWSVVSGPSLLLTQFSNTASPTATFTPAGGAGSYVVRWTISNSPCTASTADATITAYSLTTAYWIGGTDTNMTTGTNYLCPGTVLSSTVDLVIPAGRPSYPVISSGQVLSVKSITIESGASITVNSGGALNVNGDLINNGTVNVSGIISFPTSSSVVDFDGSSGAFNLISTSTTQSGGIGSIASTTPANFTGNVIVQRYMGSVGGQQFRYVASPVANATKPSNLGTLYKYSGGWSKYYGTMGIGEGYAALTSQLNWAVTGAIQTGSFQWTGLPAGWNLLGNPYPSDIDWKVAGWSSTNIDPTIGVTDNSISGYPNYFKYIINTTPGSIALGQAFWVYVTTGTGSLTITESAKSATNAGRFYREDAEQAQTIFDQSFMISINNGKYSDQSFLLNSEKVSGKSMRQDLTKLFNPEMNIYFLDGHEREMLTHTLRDLPADIKIPIGVEVNKAGEYEISFRNTETFDRPLYLIDQQEGQAIPVSATMTYKVTINDVSRPHHDRFYLSPKAEVKWNAEASVSIYPNPARDVVNIHTVGLSSTATLMDINGNVLTSGDFKGEGTIDMANYPAGMYFVKIKTEHGMVTKKIVKYN